MPATISVTVDDPPDPPAGFVADGFQLHRQPVAGGTGLIRPARTLTDAVAAWVGIGVERTDLFALATSRNAGGDLMACSWVEETGKWGEWQNL